MDKRTKNLINFLDASCSVFHAVRYIADMLAAKGYQALSEGEKWELVPGGKYYVVRNSAALIAFRVPEGESTGFLMSAAHADWPSFKLRNNGEVTGKYTSLSMEAYGGMICSSWMDRPLSIAGRVMVETENGAAMRLVNLDQDLMLMPNAAIHMSGPVINDGYKWTLTDNTPLLGGKNSAGKIWKLLEKAAGGKILSHELYTYVRQKATVWGVDKEYLSSAAIDDLTGVWCCTQGFLNAGESRSIPVLCVFDSEEVGSNSAQGADSDFLEHSLLRICGALHLDPYVMLHNSFMMSSDNAHALHPNHPEYADPLNAPLINEGLILKFSARLSYPTDVISAAIFRKVCARANVPVQVFQNKPGVRGGSTLARISISHVTVPSADIGLPQLAMHSAYETVGVKDAIFMEQAMTEYYSSTLTVTANGEYSLD